MCLVFISEEGLSIPVNASKIVQFDVLLELPIETYTVCNKILGRSIKGVKPTSRKSQENIFKKLCYLVFHFIKSDNDS